MSFKLQNRVSTPNLMAMDSQNQFLHFVLVPLMSPGHLMPMIDMAKLLAQQNVTVSIMTTPRNTPRFKSTVDRCVESGFRINLLEFQFPSVAAGLPEGCENMDSLPSRHLIKNFFVAASMLKQPFEDVFENLKPRPSCIVSGKNMAWTVETARKFRIPRFFFDGMGCFSFVCTHNLENSKVHERVLSGSEPFVVPGLAHRIELRRCQLPENLNPGSPDLTEVRNKMVAAESITDGILVNTFEEFEPDYVKEYKRVKGVKVWCVGPLSACNKLEQDKSERGLIESKSVTECLKWLDSQEPNSVIYACLGSICGLVGRQLVELGLGLESSNRPFIWVIRGGERSREVDKWIEEERFEERIKGRGFIIRGWAPQLLILSHKSIGGFLTHCGWNSMTEGACAGVPIITCPLFAEQFINERVVVDVVGTGVSAGIEAAVTWGMEEKFGLVLRKEGVKEAIEKAMDDESEEGKKRKMRAREVGKMAKGAIEEGGSSFNDMTSLIQDVAQQNFGCYEKHNGFC